MMPWFSARDWIDGIFLRRLEQTRVHIDVLVHTTCTEHERAFTAIEALQVAEWCGYTAAHQL